MNEIVERIVARSTQGGWRIYSIEERNDRYYLYCRAGNTYTQAAGGTKLCIGSGESYVWASSRLNGIVNLAKAERRVTEQLSGLEELALMMVEEEHDD